MKVPTKIGDAVWLKSFICGEDAISCLHLLMKCAPGLWLEVVGGVAIKVTDLDLSAALIRELNGMPLPEVKLMHYPVMYRDGK